MKTIAAIATLLIATGGVFAQFFPSPPDATRSLSGQFVVFGARSATLRPAPRGATNANWVNLEPTLVTVSAERIKQAVWRELGVTGAWQSKIAITLHMARYAEEPVKIVADRSMGTWSYRLEMPDQIYSERYLRAMVQVVLMELANRAAGERSAEIPLWLVEGMTRQLLASHGPDLVLNTPRLSMNGVTYNQPVITDFRPVSQLEKAHKTLVGETPLTFEELCWPVPGQIEGSDGPRFRACAQVFIYGLLKLPDGRDCMREFIAAMPAYLNWQMAFLEGFKRHFARPLDVEKWWALQSTGFAGRDLIQTWTFEESWRKLSATLVAQVDVFRNPNEMPQRADLKLQAIIRDWEPATQEAVLRGKIQELESLRFRIAPELAGLTTEYSQAMEIYLKQRDPGPGGRQRAPLAPKLVMRGQRDMLKLLDTLDAQVEKMRPRSLVAKAQGAGSR